MTKEELTNEIRIAFEVEKYPGDSHIVYDNTGYDLEANQIRKSFKDRSWQSLSLDTNLLFYERASIHFLCKEGFKYYLPAFMVIVVDEYNEMDDLPDTIVNKLILPAEIDTVLTAEAIIRTQSDKQFPQIDFYKILQDQLNRKDRRIHDFIDYMSQFNKEQSVAILHFLEYMRLYSEDLMYSPQTAIDRYWFQFAEDVFSDI